MLNNDTTTKPDVTEIDTRAKHGATNPKASHQETGLEPHEAIADNQPDLQEMISDPDFEIIKPRPDLNKLFTFDGGYCNPPKGSWYSPGTSGNPNGRPKGSKNKPKKLTDKNFNEILRSVFYRDVKTAGGRVISTAQALTENLVDLALRSNLPAIKLALTVLDAIDTADAAQQEREYDYAVRYKDHWTKSSTLSGPGRKRPVPDPDHIILDHKNKRVLFTGPRNEEEMWKKLTAQDYQKETTEEEDAEIERNEIASEYLEKLRSAPLPFPWEEGEAVHSSKVRPDEEPRLRRRP